MSSLGSHESCDPDNSLLKKPVQLWNDNGSLKNGHCPVDKGSDDDEDYDDGMFESVLEMSDDQKQVISELFSLKLDLGFTAGS